MTCKETESLVMPYIHKEPLEREMEELLEHIETCEDCKEELEIYYAVDVNIQQLDMDTGTYNTKGATEEDITTSKQRLYTLRVFGIYRYAFDTLMIACVLVVLVLQIRI